MRATPMLIGTALLGASLLSSPAPAAAQGARTFLYFAPGSEVDRETGSQIYSGGIGWERALEPIFAVQFDGAALSHFDENNERKIRGMASIDAVFNTPDRRVQAYGVI